MPKEYTHHTYATGRLFLDGWFTIAELKTLISSHERSSEMLRNSMRQVLESATPEKGCTIYGHEPKYLSESLADRIREMNERKNPKGLLPREFHKQKAK